MVLQEEERGLSLEKINERLKSPKKSETVRKASEQENRLRFHTDINISRYGYAQRPATEFLNWVRTLLPTEKYGLFVSMFRMPSYTNQITQQIFDELSRVFDGRNASENYQFTDSKLRDDWQ